ncbi:MAG TPA: hypothetical protein VFZ34_19015 [Blastocatellia bacterium]|nr:hypothetical protein [Blastocatellia bacterium]
MQLLHQALFLSLVLFVSQSITAQIKKIACPSLEIAVPNQTIIEGDLITLKASVAGKVRSPNVAYNWTVSAGEIVSGQGTSTLQIKTDNLGGAYVTATVEVKGWPTSCATIKSESFAVKPGCPNFKLELPPAPVEEGQPAILTAKVAGSGAHRVTFHWMVSAGRIRRGQATSAIEVDTSKLGGVGILAAVELGGLAPACRTSGVVAVMVAKKAGKKSKRQITADE